MSELSDYKRMVEAPMVARYDARIRELRARAETAERRLEEVVGALENIRDNSNGWQRDTAHDALSKVSLDGGDRAASGGVQAEPGVPAANRSHEPSAEGAVSPWRPIETASEHDVAYKALGIALAALQHIQGMEPITQEITLPTVMAQHAVDALKEIEALGATSCPNPCGECRGVVRAGKCGVCGWEPAP